MIEKGEAVYFDDALTPKHSGNYFGLKLQRAHILLGDGSVASNVCHRTFFLFIIILLLYAAIELLRRRLSSS